MIDQPIPTFADLGAPLARGRTAEIYAWAPGWVVKLFLPSFSRKAIEREAEVARNVHATGLPAPAVDRVVEVDGRAGIVYEWVDGPTLLSGLVRQPWRVVAVARLMGRLHADMHGRVAPALPTQRDRLLRKIEEATPLTPELRANALAMLHQLPDSNRLCHGDFHPDNILATRAGPVIIDWHDATCGHPLADVARTLVLTRFGGVLDPTVRLTAEQTMRWLLRGVYLYTYRRWRPYEHDGEPKGEHEALRQWLIPVTAARLAEKITEEEPHLLAYLQELCASR